MQSRKHSAYEVLTNTFTGMVGSWIITWLSFATIENREVATTVTVLGCTVWSLLRGYAIRRHFARRHS